MQLKLKLPINLTALIEKIKALIPSKILKSFDLRRGESFVVGVDIGTSTLKIVGLCKSAKKPSVVFSSIKEMPDNCDDNYVTKAINEELVKADFSHKNALLTFSNESVIFRRLELPSIPRSEVKEALRWGLKDAVTFDMANAAIAYEILGEFDKEDGSKALEILCAAVPEDLIKRKVKILKDALLNVTGVGISPFGMENILKRISEIAPTDNIVIIDFGHSRTIVSVFTNNVLQFVRPLMSGSRGMDESICRKLLTDSKDEAHSVKTAEGLKKRLGISYEDVPLEGNLDSRQVLSCMRHVLEQLTKEAKRSIDYFIQQYATGPMKRVYLTGGGSRLKNLDRYLQEELNIPVKKLALPPDIEAKKDCFEDESELSIMPLLGQILNLNDDVNIIPYEYRVEKVEFIEKISLRVTAIVVAAILLVSLLFTWIRIGDYKRRLLNIPQQKAFIEKARDLYERVSSRELLLKEASRGSFSLYNIFFEVGKVILPNVVLDGININTKERTVRLKGVVYGPRSSLEETLTKFMEGLERSVHFKEAELSAVQTSPQARGEEFSRFEMTCMLE